VAGIPAAKKKLKKIKINEKVNSRYKPVFAYKNVRINVLVRFLF